MLLSLLLVLVPEVAHGLKHVKETDNVRRHHPMFFTEDFSRFLKPAGEADNEFKEACHYYKKTRKDFTCTCDEENLSISCGSELECEKDTLLCARFSLNVSFEQDKKMTGTKVCVAYNEAVSQTEVFDYHDGCILIEAGDGLVNNATCVMYFDILGEQKGQSPLSLAGWNRLATSLTFLLLLAKYVFLSL